MYQVVKKSVLFASVFTLVMTLTACGSGSYEAKTETEISICDEFGNRYSSEDEPKAKGLEMYQYGVTYCPEYKPELN